MPRFQGKTDFSPSSCGETKSIKERKRQIRGSKRAANADRKALTEEQRATAAKRKLFVGSVPSLKKIQNIHLV